MGTIYTILAFYLAALAFFFTARDVRERRKHDKKDILTIIEKELDLMGAWLSTSYYVSSYREEMEPKWPLHMVYSIANNESIKVILSNRSVTLLSPKFLENLVELNQKLGSFEQHIQRMISFCTADPILATKATHYFKRKFKFDGKRLENKEEVWEAMGKLSDRLLKNDETLLSEEIYLVGVNNLLKTLHTEGIGNIEDTNSLRWSYSETRKYLEREKEFLDYEKQFKRKWWEELLSILVIFTLLIPVLYFFSSFCIVIVRNIL